ncbi:hypothetical protein PI124_g3536 [Phytophthora idaei]|nr:hypothetical protein PI125_g2902 [Phytophthora idaei]KAG3251898.1 hypothetical protein PI124_g3536 [Phytophthora idaei]
MIRGKFILGALYREKEDGTVDVYIQQYLEAMGNVFDSFVISSTWHGLLGFFRSPVLAEHKKLVVYYQHEDRSSDLRNSVICLAPVCSNCREEQVLRELERHPKKKKLLVKKRDVYVCRPCQEFVERHKATDIARNNLQEQLTPGSDSTGDNVQHTWGLLYGDSMPSWSPTRSLSMSSDVCLER